MMCNTPLIRHAEVPKTIDVWYTYQYSEYWHITTSKQWHIVILFRYDSSNIYISVLWYLYPRALILTLPSSSYQWILLALVYLLYIWFKNQSCKQSVLTVRWQHHLLLQQEVANPTDVCRNLEFEKRSNRNKATVPLDICQIYLFHLYTLPLSGGEQQRPFPIKKFLLVSKQGSEEWAQLRWLIRIHITLHFGSNIAIVQVALSGVQECTWTQTQAARNVPGSICCTILTVSVRPW